MAQRQATQDSNVIQLIKKHDLFRAIIGDPRPPVHCIKDGKDAREGGVLNVTARLAMMLTRLSDNRWGCAFIRTEEMMRWLGTNKRQLYYSLEQLIQWRMFRRVMIKENGRAVTQYYPILDDGEDITCFAERLQNDDRLDACVRLHWVVAEMIEDGVSAQFADSMLGWEVSGDAMRQARTKMLKRGHFVIEPGRGKIPTLYRLPEKIEAAERESTPEPTPEQTCTYKEYKNPSGRNFAKAKLRDEDRAVSDDDLSSSERGGRPPSSETGKATPDRNGSSRTERLSRSRFAALQARMHRVLDLTPADCTWAILVMLRASCGDAAIRFALEEYRLGDDLEDWLLPADPTPRERLSRFVARCRNLHREGFTNAA